MDISNNYKRKGIAALWTAMMFIFIIALMGLMLDWGWGFLAVHQIQNAADAAALAGARFVPLVFDPNTMTDDPSVAKDIAHYYGTKHISASLSVHLDEATDFNPDNFIDGNGEPIPVDPYDDSLTDDIYIGRYIDDSGLFFIDHESADAMLVIARREGAADQPLLGLMFGHLAGVDTAGFKRYAIAKINPDYGAGVLALGECDCPGIIFGSSDPQDPALTIFGAGGSSLYVNSPYDPGGNDGAIDQSGNAGVDIDVDRINVVGSIDDNFDIPDDADIEVGSAPEPDPYAYLPDHDLPAIRALPDKGTITDTNEPATYSPGYYSGGIQISSSEVTLEPGDYYLDSIKPDGTLHKASMDVNGGLITGEGVTLHIIGDADMGVNIGGNANIDISAPHDSSTYAGVAIYQKRDPSYDCAQSCTHPWQQAVPISEFNGNGDIILDGGVYMPHNRLELGGTGYMYMTRLVADRFYIYGDGAKEVYYIGERKIAPRSWLVE